eukprot:jgi/Chlat1/8179/Chrsp76S07654
MVEARRWSGVACVLILIMGGPVVVAPGLARALTECQLSVGCHKKYVKMLADQRRKDRDEFLRQLCLALKHALLVFNRSVEVDRLLKFVTALATFRDKQSEDDEEFVEALLTYLADLSCCKDKAVRYRTCQLVAAIMHSLDEDAGLMDQVYEVVRNAMVARLKDKIPAVRSQAARALARMQEPDKGENDPVTAAYLQILASEKNKDVRKYVLAAIDMTGNTISSIIDRTRDRVLLLRRGLADRAPVVRAACAEKLLPAWLKNCDGDAVELLRHLDVERHEKVAETVLVELITMKAAKLPAGTSLRMLPAKNGLAAGQRSVEDAVPSSCSDQSDCEDGAAEIEQAVYGATTLAAEQALWWRVHCLRLHAEAAEHSSKAATSTGAEAAVAAAAADEKHTLLEEILPATVAELVDLIKQHTAAGPDCLFASRQLLQLLSCYDFADGTSRRAGTQFLVGLLKDVTLDADPIRHWLRAQYDAIKHVLGDQAALVEELMKIAEELRNTRDGAATWSSQQAEVDSCKQWVRCLQVTSLLLEDVSSTRSLKCSTMSPSELLKSVLLTAVTNTDTTVRAEAVRCIGLYCLLDPEAAVVHSRLLRVALQADALCVRIQAARALFDLAISHTTTHLDSTLLVPDVTVQDAGSAADSLPLTTLLQGLLSKSSETSHEIVDDADDASAELDVDAEDPWVDMQSVAAEGFAKLLMFDRVLDAPEQVLAGLLVLYFNQAECTSSREGADTIKRKQVQKLASYMLQLLQTPLLSAENQETSQDADQGQERLGIAIALEIIGLPQSTGTCAAYAAALCKTLCGLSFRPSKQLEIRMMLNRVDSILEILVDKPSIKLVTAFRQKLAALDHTPQQGLSNEELAQFAGLAQQLMVEQQASDQLPFSEASDVTTTSRQRGRKSRAHAPKTSVSRASISSKASEESLATSATRVMRPGRQSKANALNRMSMMASKPVKSEDAKSVHVDASDDSSEASQSELSSESETEESDSE